MSQLKHDNYYHRKGITLKMAIAFCINELGLNPNRWNNLEAARDMLEINKMFY